jgi:CRP/FNR family transcriptional regulator
MVETLRTYIVTLIRQLDDVTWRDVATRLANWLVKRCPYPQSTEPVHIDLDMTKQTLAAELGTVSETLSRAFASFRARKLISVKGNSGFGWGILALTSQIVS